MDFLKKYFETLLKFIILIPVTVYAYGLFLGVLSLLSGDFEMFLVMLNPFEILSDLPGMFMMFVVFMLGGNVLIPLVMFILAPLLLMRNSKNDNAQTNVPKEYGIKEIFRIFCIIIGLLLLVLLIPALMMYFQKA